jgi:hypothetical protein
MLTLLAFTQQIQISCLQGPENHVRSSHTADSGLVCNGLVGIMCNSYLSGVCEKALKNVTIFATASFHFDEFASETFEALTVNIVQW